MKQNIEDLAKNFEHIKGWGVDADPKNEPTYPMKNWTGDDHKRLNYERPVQQQPREEILHSNERPGLTAVFGTSAPPSGISGAIRRLAFRYSEGKWWHWLLLIAADRVNMIEGVAEDLKSGHIPNIPAERGWNAEWKYNRKGVIKTAGIALVAGAALYALWKLNRDEDE